ncbi:hypothetical protein [Mangrovicoccus sp. HB161399]|uniref:hypothetical protein n=1 Tax=Mangrovicoccus sp. HB161399 TaxID=2720392 RepID=UPI001555D831|nr:hypothetical protein [Mangrovicoccus sp. HB161399]
MADFAPDDLQFSSFEITAGHTVGMARSPYSNAQAVYDFGGDIWSATATLAPYHDKLRQARVEGWLIGLRGPLTPFRLYNFDHDGPYGFTNGAPTVTGGALQKATTLTLQHVLPGGQIPMMEVGDWFTFSERLYRVVSATVTDGAGAQTIGIFPPLRTNIGDGNALNISTPNGRWRLMGDPLSIAHDWRSGRTISIEMIEALE